MFIRHAEKPAPSMGAGIDEDGKPDEESLSVRGWQRAGALTQFFRSGDAAQREKMTPGCIFAAGSGPGSKSNRSMQTVAPLVRQLQESAHIKYSSSYLKDDGEALMHEVLAETGVILIAWEHKILPSLIGLLPNAPTVPSAWPEHRFDMVWIVEREGEGWRFSQHPQLLLAGDSAEPIK